MKNIRLTNSVHLCLLLTLPLLAVRVAEARTVLVRSNATSVALVNAASYEAQVAPGSIAALFGSGMTNQAGAPAATIPLPLTLAGVSVKINGISAPLFYGSASQINLQVPSAVTPGNATIEVFNTGSQTPIATGAIVVVDSSPGTFTINASGKDQAAALNSDSSINANFDQVPGSHPEITGNYVTIFATGIGPTSPVVPDGQAAPGNPLAIATATTAITIGGVPAQVLFSGLAPGYVGLWQINAYVPASLATNFATPLKVELRGKQSSGATLAVASTNEYGSASGSVVSALTGGPIGGATVKLQPASGTTHSVVTDSSGRFVVAVVKAGAYDTSTTATGYVTATQTVTIAGGSSETLAPIALTEPLAAGQYRVVVTWSPGDASGLDLDAHLTGPAGGAGRFHVWWNGETDVLQSPSVRLDRDDLTGSGPETLTITPQGNATYRFSVHNYSDRDTPGALRINTAHAVVRVYLGSQQVAIISAPSGGGTLWKVFEAAGNQLSVVNQLSDEYEPSNIKVSF